MMLTGLLVLAAGVVLMTAGGIPAVKSHLRTFDSLVQYRDYRFLWVGNFCSNTALWLQLLTVGWLVRDLTAGSGSSGLLVVTVGALNTIPILLVGPWGGVLGDRIDRRRMVIGVQSFMAVMAVLFALIIWTGRVEWWHPFVYVLIGGSCWSITLPLQQTLIANTVPQSAIVNAYATNVLTITGTRFLGPLVGGILIATLGFSWNFILEAAFYVGTVLAMLPMQTPYYQRSTTAHTTSIRAELAEGINYIWKKDRVILHLIVLGLIPNMILHPVWFLLPLFTAEVLHRGADVGGYLLAVTGVGGLAAALAIASFGQVRKKGIICIGSLLWSSTAAILFAGAQWLVAAIVLIGLMAIAQSAFRTMAGAIVQERVPDALRSRVTSLHSYSMGFLILSSLLIGWYVDLTTVTIGLLTIGAVGLCLAVFSTFAFRQVRELD